ncbi:DUF6193 family natural product biosynthesis protein [Streptomyces sp. NPDC021608]|uniref:DUF6193 family natural product biosynthesis protein n=1 Tax=Streptomyces sp. NPDC021608 TaxID=3154903 RepID=UPI0033E906A9
MAASLDPAAPYADIAAVGSLAAALRAAADAHGLDVPFEASASQALLHASVPSPAPHRAALTVRAWAAERRWSIGGHEPFQDLALVTGDTRDLVQVALAAQGWHDGTALDDIHRAAPFTRLTGRFEVPDRDPAALAESEWRHLRTEADDKDRPRYRALVEAAYAESALRALYPFTSHGTLRFSTSTRPRLTVVPLCLNAWGEGPYTLSAQYMGEAVAETTTAGEAVAAALAQLPPRLGPVTLGTP